MKSLVTCVGQGNEWLNLHIYLEELWDSQVAGELEAIAKFPQNLIQTLLGREAL